MQKAGFYTGFFIQQRIVKNGVHPIHLKQKTSRHGYAGTQLCKK